jgi:hypothetical protein
MKILVACEESQAVTIELRKRGHEAFSCDLLPCSGGHPEWHIQGDVLPLMDGGWDVIIAFPPCTDLAVSGARYFEQKKADGRQQRSVDFFMQFANANCPRVAIENPVGIMSGLWRKPDQIIQPWQFGHDASKKTCLWLKGLPLLKHTAIVPPKGYQPVVYAGDLPVCECCDEPFCPTHNDHYADCSCFGPTQDDLSYAKVDGYEFATATIPAPRPIWANQTPSGQNKLGPSPERAKLRSKTYEGVAKAMAEQWTTNEMEDLLK